MRTHASLIAVAILATQSTALAQVEFHLIDAPTNGDGIPDGINVTGMSADGQWIGGQSAGQSRIFRFHVPTTTFEYLSDPALTFGLADISDDGTRMVGNYINNSGIDVPGIWTEGTGWEEVPGIPGTTTQDNSFGGAFGISGDGSTVVGLFNVPNPIGAQPFLWSDLGGSIALTNSGNGGRASRSNADGSIVAGFDHDPDGGFRRAAVWVNGNLTVLSPDRWGDVEGINSVGDVLVGNGDKGFLEGAMRWSWDGASWTATNLGTLPGTDPLFYSVSGLDVSSDGSVIVGINRSGLGPFAAANGFIWTQADGMVNLEDLLSDNGVDINGFDIQVASGVSNDGTVISGWGWANGNPIRVGWFIMLGAPCQADLTGEGDLNFFDVSEFLAAFAASDSAADFDDNGAFNFFDISAFLAAFSAGCP